MMHPPILRIHLYAIGANVFPVPVPIFIRHLSFIGRITEKKKKKEKKKEEKESSPYQKITRDHRTQDQAAKNSASLAIIYSIPKAAS